jgi:uncharacterized iron-regulated membrane protein
VPPLGHCLQWRRPCSLGLGLGLGLQGLLLLLVLLGLLGLLGLLLGLLLSRRSAAPALPRRHQDEIDPGAVVVDPGARSN